jgi:plastocyanin
MRDHIEVSPPSHIVTVPIPENIQKHMLEHADGGGDPGIVIQYNCDKFECENDLISKLTQIAEEFPDNVYLAPNKYDALIVLTKLGRRKVLDDFDGDEIRKFINPNYVPGEPQEPATETISMEAGLFFFTPETLEAKVGEEVILNISATGGHTFTIDELDVNVSLPHGETTRVLFTPEVTGTFEYYCSIPGHRESGQMGMLEVL